MSFVAFFVSDMIGGILSDRIGRKSAIVISAILVAFSSAMVALFGRSYYAYPIGRFALIATTFYNQVGYQYCMELVVPKYRGTIGVMADVGACGIGIILVSLNGFVSRDWLQCHHFLALSVGISIPFFLTMPESYRWYFGKGYVHIVYHVALFCTTSHYHAIFDVCLFRRMSFQTFFQ